MRLRRCIGTHEFLVACNRPRADRHQYQKVNLEHEEKFSSALLDVMSPDAKIRNLAAITLMDSGNPESVPALVDAIEFAAHREARGTLIYALSAFDCSSHLPQIFRWAIEGGFEASHEAISILKDQGLKPTEVERQNCLAFLRSVQNHTRLDNELRDELLSYLE